MCVYVCVSGVWGSLGPSWLFVCLWASPRASVPVSTSVAPARAGCVGASLGTYLSGCECVRCLAARHLSASEAVTPCSLAYDPEALGEKPPPPFSSRRWPGRWETSSSWGMRECWAGGHRPAPGSAFAVTVTVTRCCMAGQTSSPQTSPALIVVSY